jgi:DNA-binding transcriptional MerR regulator
MTQWTLEQLGERVREALTSRGYVPAASGRVRAVPDGRTIRYYTTLGLVDRPCELRGRTAYYGQRHLLQLVAIKRLQAGGLSLRRVQERLGGLDDAALAAIALLNDEDSSRTAPPAPAVAAEAPAEREDFWSARPPVAPPAPARPTAHVPALWGLSLAPQVTLLLPGGRTLSQADLTALLRAAEPLVHELSRQGMLDKEES